MITNFTNLTGTIFDITDGQNGNILTIVGFGLFLISEALPFIKNKKHNGVLQIIICLLKGSNCFLTKLIRKLEPVSKDEPKPIETFNTIEIKETKDKT